MALGRKIAEGTWDFFSGALIPGMVCYSHYRLQEESEKQYISRKKRISIPELGIDLGLSFAGGLGIYLGEKQDELHWTILGALLLAVRGVESIRSGAMRRHYERRNNELDKSLQKRNMQNGLTW